MDIEIGEISSEVRVMDQGALVSPQIKHMLLQEFMKHVGDRDDHARRVRRERDMNAGRTTEIVP
jgi:hypothetical protein